MFVRVDFQVSRADAVAAVAGLLADGSRVSRASVKDAVRARFMAYGFSAPPVGADSAVDEIVDRLFPGGF